MKTGSDAEDAQISCQSVGKQDVILFEFALRSYKNA